MFEAEFAKELRGTAFYSEKGKEDWKLFCRAYPKFFNLGEIPGDFTENNDIIESYEKLDGSVIFFGSIKDKIIAKSKTSINSDQAKMAQDIFDNNEDIKLFCSKMIDKGETPVFELVGPDNVIVLRYSKNELVLLGTVNNVTGKITTYENLNIRTAEVYKGYTWDKLLEIQETAKPDIEGFVVKTENGLVKVKVKSYVQLHHLKDSVNNTKTLATLILDDNLDDLLGSFRDEKDTIDYIISMQDRISEQYNHLVKTVEDMYEETKHLSRKEFAIKNKERPLFGLVMSKYLGKDIDYKTFFMKNKLYEI